MPKLKIDSSLHDPVEIEINGVVYAARRLNRKTLQDVLKFDERVSDGDIGASYDRLGFMIPDLKAKALEELDIVQVGEITQFILRHSFKAQGEEKNGQGLGDKKSPS